MLIPPILHLAKICLKGRARLRCAVTGLACERYRSACGSWPSALEDVVPRFISSLPVDPFDGKPLRFRPANGQITIYSVGENGRDDGGQTESEPRSSWAADLEFHLWDVPSRHSVAIGQSTDAKPFGRGTKIALEAGGMSGIRPVIARRPQRVRESRASGELN